MTKLQKLNKRMLSLKDVGLISQKHHYTYMQLIEVMTLLDFEVSDGGMSDPLRDRARELLGELN